MSTEFRQDMPPKGGYRPINFKRVPAKTLLSGWAMIGGYIGMTAGATYLYALNVKAVKAREIELTSANYALQPMLKAERDRAYLLQLRRNRDEEDDLMKNVEGWKTGTWYGEPLYITQKPDTLNEPKFHEYYVHAKYKDFATRSDIGLLS